MHLCNPSVDQFNGLKRGYESFRKEYTRRYYTSCGNSEVVKLIGLCILHLKVGNFLFSAIRYLMLSAEASTLPTLVLKMTTNYEDIKDLSGKPFRPQKFQFTPRSFGKSKFEKHVFFKHQGFTGSHG